MKNNELFSPTILLPEIYFPYVNKKGFLAKKIEEIAEDGFYHGVEVASITDSSDRKRIKQAVTESDLTLTQWMTALITEKSLDLSAVDASERMRAVEQIKENLHLATECGANYVALITGPDPGAAYRQKAKESLFKSLQEICAAASDYGLEILVEPLDRNAHKRKFLGPTDETIEIISEVKQSYKNIGLAFDTAHAALNDESLVDALELSWPHISQLHLSNAVLDKNNNLFGDNHISIGEPGFLNDDYAMEIFEKIEELTNSIEKKLRVSVEVRTSEKQDPEITENNGRLFLNRIMENLK